MFKLLAFFIFTAVLVGCESSCNKEIISRNKSPDGLVEVVVVENNCGATTSFSNEVYIASAGSESLGNHVFLADKITGLKVDWIDKQQLTISYEKARIFQYTNFWQSEELENFNYVVAIQLKLIERK